MNKTIAVLFGGKSTEHDISIITALGSIIKPLELSKKYDVLAIYITKDGKWYCDEKLKDISLYQTGAIDVFCQKNKPISVVFDGGLTIKTNGLRPKSIKIDVAFPAMHGAYGEDGSLMGLLRMAGIPFVGSDMQASVIAMDKILAKQVAQANGILTPRYEFFTKDEFEASRDLIIDKIMKSLIFPMFVKPPHLGSSIGISKVKNRLELVNAIEVAAHYDDRILVEESVKNLIEVTVPIIGNDILTVAFPERPLIGGKKFFDFETKYINGGKKGGSQKANAQGYSELPANIGDKLLNGSKEVAQRMYVAAGCEGISRIDLLIDAKTEKIYFNEINPMPGSLYAHNWRAYGISNVELVERLVQLAEDRFVKISKNQTVFESSFLKQF